MKVNLKLMKQISSLYTTTLNCDHKIITNELLEAKSMKQLTYHQMAKQLDVNKVCWSIRISVFFLYVS